MIALAIFVNLQEFLVVALKFPAFVSTIDELVALLAYPVALIGLRSKRQWWVYLILLLPILSVAYSALASFNSVGAVDWNAVSIQSLINFKFFLYFLIFYFVWLKQPGVFETSFKVCLLVSLVGLGLNVLFPGYFIYSDSEYASERQRLIGFQYKPNDLALLLSYYFAYLIVAFRPKKIIILMCGFLISLIVISTSRSALFVCALAFGYYLWFSRKLGGVLLLLALVAPFLFILFDFGNSFLVSETVSNFSEFSTIESSQYIRFIMLYYGFVLAFQYFPFGVGAGGFGTVMSADSPIYSMLGLSRVRFFEEMIGVFDSNLASILGEYGFLGLALFFYLSARVIGRVAVFSKMDVLFFVAVIAFVASFQPMFSYQVNSINVLMLVYAVAARKLANSSDRQRGYKSVAVRYSSTEYCDR